MTPSLCLSRGWTDGVRKPKEVSRISLTLSFMALVERTGRAVNSRALPRSDFLSETSLEAAARVRDPGFPGGSVVKNLPANAGDPGLIPGLRRCPGEQNVTLSSVLAWRTPWTEEPGRL